MKKDKKELKEKSEIENDCVFYQKSKCYILVELVCKNKKCTFYKPNIRVDML